MSRNTAKPRFATKPIKGSKLAQVPILKTMDRLGTPAMTWQKRAIRLIGERRDPTTEELDQFGSLVKAGVPRYRQVIVSVPRQAGKTSLAKGFLVTVAEERDRLDLYMTSTTRLAAVDHLMDLSLDLPEVHFIRSSGSETLTFDNGSTIKPIPPNKTGGHGTSIDGGLIDEAWELTDDVMQGMIPAMSARPLAQLIVISTMGTLESVAWNNIVKMGREATEDPDATMAYLEYSAPDDEAALDFSRLKEWHPALGLTVSLESIKADAKFIEAGKEGRAGVIRAYGNRTTEAKESIIPSDLLDGAWRVIQPPERMVLALDVNEGPPGAAVVSGHLSDEGEAASRMVEWRYGSNHLWVPELIQQMILRRNIEAVVADFGGPAKEIEPHIKAICEETYTPLVDRRPGDLAGDTQRFLNGLKEGRVVMLKNPELVESIAGAMRKPYKDTWLISRTLMSVDASPLIATILSVGLAEELAVAPVVGFSLHP